MKLTVLLTLCLCPVTLRPVTFVTLSYKDMQQRFRELREEKVVEEGWVGKPKGRTILTTAKAYLTHGAAYLVLSVFSPPHLRGVDTVVDVDRELALAREDGRLRQ